MRRSNAAGLDSARHASGSAHSVENRERGERPGEGQVPGTAGALSSGPRAPLGCVGSLAERGARAIAGGPLRPVRSDQLGTSGPAGGHSALEPAGCEGSSPEAPGPREAGAGGPADPRSARSRAGTERASGPAAEPSAPPRRIAVAVSGGGRSLDNLARRAARLSPPIEIALVLADRAGIGAFAVATRHALPILRLEPASFPDRAAWSAALFAAAEAAEAELLVLAGFLRQIRLPPAWHRRVLNIHPSLLPKYGGKGYYGERVHAAVLAAGESESGCSVHFVDDRYDEGPLLLQRRVPVLPGDDVARLAERVFAAEVEALPAAIELFFRSS